MARSPKREIGELRNRLQPCNLRLAPIEYVLPESLARFPGRLRKLPQKQIVKLMASIGQFGMVNPILVDEHGVIIAGEARLEACVRLELKQVPVIRLSHLSATESRALRIADNKLSEEGRWDLDALAVELEGILEVDELEIELTGFDTAEIDVMLLGAPSPGQSRADAADLVPQTPADPVSRLGDLWHLGNHRLLCGSSLEPEVWVRLMGDEVAAAAFVDPPYNVSIAGNVSGLGKVKHGEFQMASGEMNSVEFTGFNVKWLRQAASNARPGAILFICMDWRHLKELLAAIDEAGLEMLNLCVWAKTNGSNGAFYRSQHELVFVLRKPGAQHTNNIQLGRFGRYRTNVWTYAGANSFGASRMEDLAAHPTVKPIGLVADAIRDVTNKGEVVVDAFIGSGTTILAAERTGRRARGIEIEPGYVDVSISRWEKVSTAEATLAETGETFAEVRARRASEANLAS